MTLDEIMSYYEPSPLMVEIGEQLAGEPIRAYKVMFLVACVERGFQIDISQLDDDDIAMINVACLKLGMS